jgi:hypothetical protein
MKFKNILKEILFIFIILLIFFICNTCNGQNIIPIEKFDTKSTALLPNQFADYVYWIQDSDTTQNEYDLYKRIKQADERKKRLFRNPLSIELRNFWVNAIVSHIYYYEKTNVETRQTGCEGL